MVGFDGLQYKNNIIYVKVRIIVVRIIIIY